jgi:uracil-DNA glycosylase
VKPSLDSAINADDVVAQAREAASLPELTDHIVECRACPRLVEWREDVGREKRRSFADQTYWARPVPGFGVADPSVLIVGLAPAAHGGNRTGRVFTGDRSGDWLFASMYRTGLANQPESSSSDDGLELIGARVLAAVRCAPPQNRPTTGERDTCAPWLDRELKLLSPHVQVVVALGAFAWDTYLAASRRSGAAVPTPKPRFGHGVEVLLGEVMLLGCFHPSQQNTFTGRLTEPMLDAVLARAAELGGLSA